MAALTSTVLGLFQQSCKVSILQQDTFQVQHDPNKHLSSSFKRRAKFWKMLELFYKVGASRRRNDTRGMF